MGSGSGSVTGACETSWPIITGSVTASGGLRKDVTAHQTRPA
jgi:hypothetical protein